ncbi:MAG: trigger factor [Proteobacteria bacterium]|nr:MAG: trigger factor [Pseudomonadota bacterium]
MEVTVETTAGLERRIKVQVPAERIDSEVEDRLKNLRGRAKIDGFRPGKVPLSVVRSKFGSQVRQEVLGEVLQSSFYEAVTQEKLRPVGGPRIDPQVMEPGKALEYTAEFEVYPEIEIGDIAAITIKRPQVEVGDSDIDKVIDRLRKQRIEWQPVERDAQDEDRIKLNFIGTIDGEEFAGGKGNDVPLVLGSGSFIPGFEEQLRGAGKGDQKTIEVRFPDDYHAKDLAGKTARFATEILEVAEPKLPELDDEFVKGFQIADGSLESFRAEIKQNMERELADAVKGRVKQQVMDGLLQVNPVDVPKALIEEEIDRLVKQTKEQMAMGQKQPQDLELPRSMFEAQAIRRVTLGLLLAEIARKHELKVDGKRVRATIEKFAASYEKPDEVVKWYYSNQEHLSNVESMVIEDQLVDWVLEQAKVSDEPMSFDAVMNPEAEKSQ